MPKTLGRVEPPDWNHVEKYPLRALATPLAKPVPVIAGINWYTALDSPVRLRDGSWWVGVDERGRPLTHLGTLRGGHCICLQPAAPQLHDLKSWWRWYNQGAEGACVGFGWSRAMSLLNRRAYQAYWLYRAAQKLEGDPAGTEGTTVRSGAEVLRAAGHVRRRPLARLQMDDQALVGDAPSPVDGIGAYRWALSIDELLGALGTPGADHVTIDNSWGEDYPFKVNVPASVIDTLRRENGEFAIPTDR